MAAGWNRGKKWSEETKKRISEGTRRNHPTRGPNREEFIAKITRWKREGVHRIDCRCNQCSEMTRRLMSRNRRLYFQNLGYANRKAVVNK